MASWKDFEKTNASKVSAGANHEHDTPKQQYQRLKEKADSGDINAVTALGLQLFSGHFKSLFNRDQSVKMASPYLHKAADYGSTKAQTALGLIYEGGLLGQIDENTAGKYYTLAARKNDGYAQYRLGILLWGRHNGNWLHWLCCAHINGEKKATEALNEVIRTHSNPSGMKKSIEWLIGDIRKNGIIPR